MKACLFVITVCVLVLAAIPLLIERGWRIEVTDAGGHEFKGDFCRSYKDAEWAHDNLTGVRRIGELYIFVEPLGHPKCTYRIVPAWRIRRP